MKKYVVWFEEVHRDDVGLVGGKGANLGEMTNAKMPIPYGFIVTSHAYFAFVKHNKLEKHIREALSIKDYEDTMELQKAAKDARELILHGDIPEALTQEIATYYHHLSSKEEEYFKGKLSVFEEGFHKTKSLYRPPRVAVRSSATAEDLPDASFAGQQETFLNVKGDTHLIHRVKECWASLFTDRAIYYRSQQGFDHFDVGLAAVVQRMVQSDKSGIAFSIDPVTNERNTIVIEAIFGLGEYIVQGKVTPDHYEVDKRSFVLLNKEVKTQKISFVRSGVDNKEIILPKKKGELQKLTDEEIINIALLVKEIEKHYGFPQDIEWAIENGRPYIVQSRPITTTQEGANSSHGVFSPSGLPTLAIGSPASPGVGSGCVKIVMSPEHIEEVKKGDVLLAPQTNPDYVPAMRRAVAIVTEKGGRTSHAAIVSRELGVPAVVGVEGILKKIKNKDVITVDGSTGEVFEGDVRDKISTHQEARKKIMQHYKTKTQVYVNLAEPEQAKEIADMDVDGIGLLRAEFMIAGIGKHPRQFIKEGKQASFIHQMEHNLLKFVKSFAPRPVVYRATDFKTNEYRNLMGGEAFEPHEENPMLGYRGASRYIADHDVFAMEVEAIKNIRAQGYENIHMMIPFIRAPWELIEIRMLLDRMGLLRSPHFKLWIMVEVPACALELEEYIKIGIDGVSIGTNDLTMMVLGVDRDNEHVADIYDERSLAVVHLLEHIVQTCVDNGITCSICGQAASDYPDLIERLVRLGITSASVTPDAVYKTRETIHTIEKKLRK